MIVTLEAEKDYLKRISVVANTTDEGITAQELASASIAAEEKIKVTLASAGFDISTWLTTATTPNQVVETIKLYASALVWYRMYMTIGQESDFENTYGQALLRLADKTLTEMMKTRVLLANDGVSLLKARDGTAQGKDGIPRIAMPANTQLITDDRINNFLEKHANVHLQD